MSQTPPFVCRFLEADPDILASPYLFLGPLAGHHAHFDRRNSANLLGLVNSLFGQSIYPLVNDVARALTIGTPGYSIQYRSEVGHFRALFMWQALAPGAYPVAPQAQFSLSIFIPTAPNLALVRLAYTLLRLADSAVFEFECEPMVQAIGYVVLPDAVVALVLYDEGLDDLYHAAVEDTAVWNADHGIDGPFDGARTTWPPRHGMRGENAAITRSLQGSAFLRSARLDI
ncbi:hypothetical protein FA95DRAFT_1571316 [Auriscalpium vulgare]|uniref:Uncharacterized protein n=1 Tax=Auriscalpium vulgare TaxID=40419 RepID=A0ACB8S051_9AGAM|nr:hypothetical protein FA95DRAFT_1571316 [Auriscalpium vulgare]